MGRAVNRRAAHRAHASPRNNKKAAFCQKASSATTLPNLQPHLPPTPVATEDAAHMGEGAPLGGMRRPGAEPLEQHGGWCWVRRLGVQHYQTAGTAGAKLLRAIAALYRGHLTRPTAQCNACERQRHTRCLGPPCPQSHHLFAYQQERSTHTPSPTTPRTQTPCAGLRHTGPPQPTLPPHTPSPNGIPCSSPCPLQGGLPPLAPLGPTPRPRGPSEPHP